MRRRTDLGYGGHDLPKPAECDSKHTSTALPSNTDYVNNRGLVGIVDRPGIRESFNINDSMDEKHIQLTSSVNCISFHPGSRISRGSFSIDSPRFNAMYTMRSTYPPAIACNTAETPAARACAPPHSARSPRAPARSPRPQPRETPFARTRARSTARPRML